MNLAEMQREFWRLAAREPGASDAAAFVIGTPELGARERVEIYADMFVWRQVDVLREDFPRLAEKLGDEAFYALAERYLRAHPSTHASLSELGARMPSFVRAERPELAELAELEWARAEVFEAPDAAPLDRLQPVSEDELPRVRLRFVPALRLLGATAVWKKGFEVRHAALEPAEARALALAIAGEPLGAVCEAFDGVEPAFRAISSWFAEGFIRGQELT